MATGNINLTLKDGCVVDSEYKNIPLDIIVKISNCFTTENKLSQVETANVDPFMNEINNDLISEEETAKQMEESNNVVNVNALDVLNFNQYQNNLKVVRENIFKIAKDHKIPIKDKHMVQNSLKYTIKQFRKRDLYHLIKSLDSDRLLLLQKYNNGVCRDGFVKNTTTDKKTVDKELLARSRQLEVLRYRNAIIKLAKKHNINTKANVQNSASVARRNFNAAGLGHVIAHLKVP